MIQQSEKKDMRQILIVDDIPAEALKKSSSADFDRKWITGA